MQLLQSKPVISELQPLLKRQVAELLNRGVEPHVADVLVGEDEASLKYVDKKAEAAKEYGITFSVYHLEQGSPVEEVKKTICFLADDPEIHGIILQLPLPASFTREEVTSLINLIPDSKDVDGLKEAWVKLNYTQSSTESFLILQPYAIPPMVLSVVSLLNYYGIEMDGKNIVIVGRGRLVGQPLERFFSKLNLAVRTVDEGTKDILSITTKADILIAGTGEPGFITHQWIKEGAVVIDCSRDVHADSVSQVAGALSPSVGGVGPLTVFWLMHNTYQASHNQS